MTLPCGCCEGTRVLTPMPTANRPGLGRLSYRAGTHAAFLETMKARLSSSDFPELAGLRTRDPSDPSIALLDAWATVADVLTFYQERTANEGYLQTATERRSILELARLVGYNLRPGVSASVYLAYTLEKDSSAVIAAGERAQSVPSEPGEKLQTFETFEPLNARSDLNSIKPRLTRPTQIVLDDNADTIDTIYIDGISTRLKGNDPLLFVFGDRPGQQVLRRIKEVMPQKAENRTMIRLQLSTTVDEYVKVLRRIIERYIDLALCISGNGCVKEAIDTLNELKQNICAFPDRRRDLLLSNLAILQNIQKNPACKDPHLQKWIGDLLAKLEKISDELPDNSVKRSFSDACPQNGDGVITPERDLSKLISLIDPVSKQPLLQPANSLRLSRDSKQIFKVESDALPQLLTALKPRIGGNIYTAWANNELEKPQKVKIYALRLAASLFGANAPPIMQIVEDIGTDSDGKRTVTFTITPDGDPVPDKEVSDTIYLDNSYDRISPDSWIAVETQDTDMTCLNSLVSKARNPQAKKSRSAYGISGSTTIIKLDFQWFSEVAGKNPFEAIRTTVVHAQAEELKLAEEPIGKDIDKKEIELGSLYPGLETGKWVIVSGERTDIPNTIGVKANELVMLAGVQQSSDQKASVDSSQGTSGVHSTLILDKGLAYTYKRDTVIIYANVVKATHGETKSEVLGSGDGTSVFQQFQLRASPLTYLPAATPAGAESTLKVRVNGALWHEADNLFDLGPKGRGYITKTDDDSKTTVIFGNGEHGARIPTGIENSRAVYRAGIGRPGNVQAGQIKLLATKPLGVKAVINPLRASGGADRERPDQGRKNAPLATMALDRLVSTEDYAFFARTYAGIGKASAASLSNGHRQLVHLTIAGSDDIPIDATSELFRNLNQALHQFGDPFQPVQVEVRELLLLVISANIRLLSDYLWENVEPKIRSALLDAFSFERRELGQSAFLSEAISVTQQVEGVDYVDIVVFDSVSENAGPDVLGNLASLGRKPFIEVNFAKPNDKTKNSKKTDPANRIQAAQLAYLSPDIKDTLILNPVELTK